MLYLVVEAAAKTHAEDLENHMVTNVDWVVQTAVDSDKDVKNQIG